MNKRQKEWQKEVNEAINSFESNSNNKYDYYGKLNKRSHIKSTKGLQYWIHWGVRITLFIILLYLTIKSYFV